MNHTPTFCALNINLKNDHKSNDLTEQKKYLTASAVPRIPPTNGHVPKRPTTKLR
jgi:hypothetical protein